MRKREARKQARPEHPQLLRAAISAIPDAELDVSDFLIVRQVARGKNPGYMVTGCGNLCDMVRAAIDNIAECAVNEKRHH